MGFYAILSAVRDALIDPGAETAAIAAAQWGRAAQAQLTKGRWKAGAGIPTLRVRGVDEDAIAEGSDRAAIGAALPTCRRMLEVEISIPLDARHVEGLEELTDAIVTDLHHAVISGIKRIEYAGLRDPEDVITQNEVERTLAFWITYPRV